VHPHPQTHTHGDDSRPARTDNHHGMHSPPDTLHLGLDAGGTATRWALFDGRGRWRAGGQAPALSGLMLADAAGRATLQAALHALQAALQPHGRPASVWAGATGVDAAQAPALAAALAEALQLPAPAAHAASDIELACRHAFAPGQGVVLIAGTGAIAAHLAADGTLQRAGGRGALIDDAGGGHWIACQALKQVWRAEDHEPGAWRRSPLAKALFEALGGSDWAQTRAFVYGASRGELGRLAQVVAAVADRDAQALALLQAAGWCKRCSSAWARSLPPRPWPWPAACGICTLPSKAACTLKRAASPFAAAHRIPNTRPPGWPSIC
jgi:glucosamine kinase